MPNIDAIRKALANGVLLRTVEGQTYASYAATLLSTVDAQAAELAALKKKLEVPQPWIHTCRCCYKPKMNCDCGVFDRCPKCEDTPCTCEDRFDRLAALKDKPYSSPDGGSAEAEARDRIEELGFAETERRMAALCKRLEVSEQDNAKLNYEHLELRKALAADTNELAALKAEVAQLERINIDRLAQIAGANATTRRFGDKCAALVIALKAYRFVEQTKGGRNPHEPGTNRHRAFELGELAITDAAPILKAHDAEVALEALEALKKQYRTLALAPRHHVDAVPVTAINEEIRIRREGGKS